MDTKVLGPTERFKRLIDRFLAAANFCGANVLREDYQMTMLTWGLIVLINIYNVCTIYTIYDGVAVRSEYSIVLEALCFSGGAVQGYCKLLNAINKAKTYRFLHSEIVYMYEEFEPKRDKYYLEQLGRSMDQCKRINITLGSIYFFVLVSVISIPLYYRLVLNQHISVMKFIIPGIDPTSEYGYIIHNVTHVCCICFGIIGNFASDVLLFMMVSHIPLMASILKRKFHELDELVRQYPVDTIKSIPHVRDIFVFHQRYIVFRETSRNTFYWIIFVQIGTTTVSIIATIVTIFLGTWPAGPVYLTYSFVMLYTYCGLGNLVDNANENIITTIYDSNWYELSVSGQKMLQIMLRDAQDAKAMTIGGIAPLTLNTALILTKHIYTIAMLLNNFLNN